eukprot:COSAG04_NODE_509_length_13229_cov_4.567145_7_plen_85_part_00
MSTALLQASLAAPPTRADRARPSRACQDRPTPVLLRFLRKHSTELNQHETKGEADPIQQAVERGLCVRVRVGEQAGGDCLVADV